jgi:hypothetical protein
VHRQLSSTANRTAELLELPDGCNALLVGDDWMHPADEAVAMAPTITDELHAMLVKWFETVENPE